VRQELEYANQLFRAHPEWPVVDVTGRAIEETAVIILETIKERDERAKAAQSALL
jgi:regulator of PEP synthase PpsR (kinase-PPPase family)